MFPTPVSGVRLYHREVSFWLLLEASSWSKARMRAAPLKVTPVMAPCADREVTATTSTSPAFTVAARVYELPLPSRVPDETRAMADQACGEATRARPRISRDERIPLLP